MQPHDSSIDDSFKPPGQKQFEWLSQPSLLPLHIRETHNLSTDDSIKPPYKTTTWVTLPTFPSSFTHRSLAIHPLVPVSTLLVDKNCMSSSLNLFLILLYTSKLYWWLFRLLYTIITRIVLSPFLVPSHL